MVYQKAFCVLGLTHPGQFHLIFLAQDVGVSAIFQNSVVYIISVYAPYSIATKRRLRAELLNIKQNFGRGEWCIVGDFNAVTSVAERKGRRGDSSMAEIFDFNNFIVDMELIDVSVTGNKFSWFSSDGSSMSRLDRFLISEGLLDLWGISGQCSRDISDHCPIWLLRSVKDWGPKSFRIFNAWFDHAEFLPFVKACWDGFNVLGFKAHVVKEKFKMLKVKLRNWNKEVFGILDLNIDALVRELNALDQILCEGDNSYL